MKKLEKLKNLELKNLSSIWGGTADCKKMTLVHDYTGGDCTIDQSCWECDDNVA
jgi:hypothetical protein